MDAAIGMIRASLGLVVLAYLPGALLYRVPLLERARRARWSAEERVFWHVLLSTTISLAIALSLALLNEYSFGRVVIASAGLSMGIALVYRSRLLYRGEAARPTWSIVLPVALVALGLWRFFPAAEYIIGGRDPGTYINEGVQIAQRGSIVIRDPVVAAVPADLKPLFFAGSPDPNSESSRFMGFYAVSLRDARVVGQFPHLYPASIALGYDMAGLTGARLATGAWALAGLLAVYFLGARLVGRAAAFAGATLLGLHVIQVWFARYPNSEMATQALLFAAILASARAHQDGDGFFAPVAGVLVASLMFLRQDALLVVACLAAAANLAWLVDGRRPRVWFVVTLAAGTIAGFAYLMGPVRPYMGTTILYFTNQPLWLVLTALAGGLAVLLGIIALRRRFASAARQAVPIAIVGVVIVAAGYAYFLRHPDPIDLSIKVRLAAHDAYAFRTFVDFYLFWPALLLALAGLVLVARRDFWRDPAFVIIFSSFMFVFFYKIRVIAEQFWMSRRFATMILPGLLLFAAAAAIGPVAGRLRGWQIPRVLAGTALLIWLGLQYSARAQPVLGHVEYAGMVDHVERLAGRFTDRDLVIVEARILGDVHVFGLPLAYLHRRNVLALSTEVPDKGLLERFLQDAMQRYSRVYFIGGGGTELLSRRIGARAIADGRAEVPEYAHTPWNVYPDGPRRKDFNYTIYELTLGETKSAGFSIDIGHQDDLHVVGFFAKEVTEGRSVRWTQDRSRISVPGLSGRERTIRFVFHDGGRPATAPPATVAVFFNDVSLGTIPVGSGFSAYDVALPAALAQQAGALDAPARITLESSTWRPRDYLPVADDRALGVMLDRVEVH